MNTNESFTPPSANDPVLAEAVQRLVPKDILVSTIVREGILLWRKS